MTAGDFFGQTEGRLYSLTLSNSSDINGMVEESAGRLNNVDAGLICDGECRDPVCISSDRNLMGIVYPN